ncbi:MAG: peptidylprolyl isomerase [Candidatus Cloacimonetes bacterium]|nr:peptidylprolyl isomerase [Candidatus Cloacimonadota bacterium]MDD3234693.1 peptidylprolyl isomerase [Candidatus Cloacimonadota bacterium]
MRYRVALIILLAISLAACNKKEEKGIALAQVGDEVLYLENFKATFGVAEWDALSADQRKKYIEDWVNLSILAKYADDNKIDKDIAVKQRILYAAKKVKANALISKRLAEVQVSEDQLFNYFRIHQSEFQKSAAEYSVQRIALEDKISAEKVLGQVSQGMNFNEAVQRYSTEALKAKNGMMGFVSAAGADSTFWLAARNIAENGYGIVSQNQLWFVFRIADKRDTSQEANFEDYRADIKRKIILEKQDQVYQDLLKEIKSHMDKIYYY